MTALEYIEEMPGTMREMASLFNKMGLKFTITADDCSFTLTLDNKWDRTYNQKFSFNFEGAFLCLLDMTGERIVWSNT